MSASSPVWYRSLAEQSLGPFEDLHDAPPLGGRQRTSLHQQHPVADAALLLVVRLQLAGTAHHLAVQRMLHLVLDRDDDGLLHLVADHVALTDLPTRPLVTRLAHAVSSRSARSRRSRPLLSSCFARCRSLMPQPPRRSALRTGRV